MAERGGLENRYGSCSHRGFESHPLRLVCNSFPKFISSNPHSIRAFHALSARFARYEGASRPSPLSLCAPRVLRDPLPSVRTLRGCFATLSPQFVRSQGAPRPSPLSPCYLRLLHDPLPSVRAISGCFATLSPQVVRSQAASRPSPLSPCYLRVLRDPLPLILK